MHMMYALSSPIGQQHLAALCQIRKHLRMKMPRRIQRHPARTHQMTRMQNRGRKTMTACFRQEIGLNGRFLASIVAEGFPRLLFRGGYLATRAMHPDGAAMKKVADLPAECFD